MTNTVHHSTRPVVLCFSGHDPCGGAGIQADIETLASIGCHCASIITTHTVQDTSNVTGYQAVSANWIKQQLDKLTQDLTIAAVKISVVGSLENIAVIETTLSGLPPVPVVLDPVISAGGGGALSSPPLIDSLRHSLLPLSTLITPNRFEAQQLCSASQTTAEQQAEQLTAAGCRHVLISGLEEIEKRITNRLYDHSGLIDQVHWPKLPSEYHGSGCTLAAAAAGFLALGLDIIPACQQAQQFTWNALMRGYRIGRGQLIPQRVTLP